MSLHKQINHYQKVTLRNKTKLCCYSHLLSTSICIKLQL